MSAPACPRCGYDLSGILAARADAWPLWQMCAECGLNVDMAHLLSEDIRHRAEFFETAKSPGRAVLMRTMRQALRPWRFWSWVRIEYPINRARAIWGVVLCALLCEFYVLLAGAVLIGAAWIVGTLAAGNTSYAYWPQPDEQAKI